MENYPAFFLSLSNWTWDTFPTLRGTQDFYLNHVLSPKPSENCFVGGGQYDFSDSPLAQRPNYPFPILDLTFMDLGLGLVN